LLCVANWPAPRRLAWRSLLAARAIENWSYCLGVNRVGADGNGVTYAGDSAVIDFLGQPLVDCGPVAQVATLSLDPAALAEHRDQFPAWRDADDFEMLG
jgi:predicted amidohydrolase